MSQVLVFNVKHTHTHTDSFCLNLRLPAAGGDVGGLGPSTEVGAGLVARRRSLWLCLTLVLLLQHGALALPHHGRQQGALRSCSPTGEARHGVLLLLLLLAHYCRVERVKGDGDRKRTADDTFTPQDDSASDNVMMFKNLQSSNSFSILVDSLKQRIVRRI